ncbi:hypothetical protein ACFST9_06520 [Hymenobacter monticola]|uniref:Uncharacterized protein n=1 Tax=Hymenobacter monticola TaxID=1705399 RepID=A0ABY4BBX0_9BACT|nr:hypothetical protein [Hymenobacter monticola]UOE36269.1 hypothetical protein MTP16_11640 [Hymenobacter monticola]
MKLPLLLLLALPLSAAAQMNGSSFGNANYQMARQQAQMSNNFQRHVMEKSMSRMNSSSASRAQLVQWQEQREKRVAKQQEAELKATAELTRLGRRQDSLRLARPAPNAIQTAARKKADEQALAQLSIKNYRDVFLPGQVMAAEEARSLPGKGMQDWTTINKELSDNDWWAKQDPAQLLAKVSAYRATLTSLTTALLGFDPATAPKPERLPSTAALDAMRAKGTFDPQVATKFLQDAARVEKLGASTKLVSALNDFNHDVAEAAARPEMQQNPQKLRNTVKSGLKDLNKAMDYYEMAIGGSQALSYAQGSIEKCASTFLPKADKNAKKRAS